MRVNIRWMIKRDLPSVMAIERASFDHPWSEDELLGCLRQRNCIGMVAESEDRIVGFMVYELSGPSISLSNFAVAPEFRRRGVGRQMIHRLADKISQHPTRDRVLAIVRETNLDAQLFFRAMGFRAFCVIHGLYDEIDEDAYAMRLMRSRDAAFLPQNRITPYLAGSGSGSRRSH